MVSHRLCSDGSPVEQDACEEGKPRGPAFIFTQAPQCQVWWEGDPQRAQLLPDMAEAPQPGGDP